MDVERRGVLALTSHLPHVPFNLVHALSNDEHLRFFDTPPVVFAISLGSLRATRQCGEISV